MKENSTLEISNMSRSLNKKTAAKLFRWEGWKKEIIWIIISLLFLVMVYAYYTETKVCKEMTTTHCFQSCLFEEKIPEITKKLQKEHPGTIVMCDKETLSCMISGVEDMVPKIIDVGGFNITFE